MQSRSKYLPAKEVKYIFVTENNFNRSMQYFVQILFCRPKQNITTNAIQFEYS